MNLPPKTLVGALLCILQSCSLTLAARNGVPQATVSPVTQIRAHDDSFPTFSWPNANLVETNQGDVLEVCDCENADIVNHGGLLCDKEGYFITSFEAVGHWINGGGRVPLSRAKCCRLCIPDDLSPKAKAALPTGAEPLGVISVGCHASTASSKVACESSPTTTFATGFQHDVLVPSLAAATFYPEGPMTCCAPALMLSNGDAWEIERCACEWSSTTGCSSMGKDYLLWGFAVFRDGGNDHHVPIAPAQCCQACLGTRIHRMDQCRSLNHCSNRGVCVLGACTCNEGWGGPDCSSEVKHQSWPPKWLVYMLMVGSMIFSMIMCLAARQIFSDYIERRRHIDEQNQAMLDPLLVAEGEIGEVDTSDEEGYEDDPPPLPMEALAGHRAASPQPPSESELAESSRRGGTMDGPDGRGTAGAGGSREDADAKDELHTADEGEEEEEDAELAAELARRFDETRSPLTHVKCGVCFERPVQVALVPCGHSSLCRHCARRMERCPYCRKPVVRRQRLYLTDS